MRSVLGAGGARLATLFVSVVSVPLLLQLLGRQQYGTWVTLTSVLAWFGMLDLGVGYSLRNSVASTIDALSTEAVQREFLAFFRFLSVIALIACLVFAVATPLVPLLTQNWVAALALYLPALLALPFLLGSSVLLGAGKAGLQAVLSSLSGWLMFAFILACYLLGIHPSLAMLAGMLSIVTILCSAVIFGNAIRLLRLAPLSLVRSAPTWPGSRLRVGLSFLVLQIASVVLFTLGNVLIYENLGSPEVARYDVVNKLFQVGLGLFNVVITVMWSEIAKYRALGDFAALRAIHRRMIVFAVAFSIGALAVSAISPLIIRLWTGTIIDVGPGEALSIAVLVSIQSGAYVGAVFLNAFEQVRIQVAMACVSIILMIPLSHLFFRSGLGIAAVPVAASFLTLAALFICNIQTNRILNERNVEKNR